MMTIQRGEYNTRGRGDIPVTHIAREIQERFRLTEKELDRAFQRAMRRTLAAGFDRAIRQYTRLTGEGRRYRRTRIPGTAEYGLPQRTNYPLKGNRQFWQGAKRVFTGVRHTGEGRVWLGLNPEVFGQRNRNYYHLPLGVFDELPDSIDPELVIEAMEKVFQAELEKAAIAAVSR